ncbi:MAG: UbiD family decarboxylase [Chloroflexi bacterium]|nr:UbiD family decarboxylase [Chloroflexota bacterium]
MQKADLRDQIRVLEEQGELVRIRKEVDARHVSGLIAQSAQALLFERVRGYAVPLVGGLVRTRRRLALSLGATEQDVAHRFQHALEHPIPPETVSSGPVKEVRWLGDEVDLTRLPIPFLSERDGGPYISSAIAIARDPEYGRNAGCYRLMYRTPRQTSIDLSSPTDLRTFYQRRLSKNEPLEVAVVVGAHAAEHVAAAYRAATGTDEFALAGGLHGAPVPLVKAETVDLEVPADAEIVLEGEIPPIGWTKDEGPFGDVTHLQSEQHGNPVIDVKAITMRRDALFHVTTMPFENIWLGSLAVEASAWQALRVAGIDVRAVTSTPGGLGSWKLIAAIRKREGEGKNAVLALLPLSYVKWVIVTDDDIDIFDPDEVDWAITMRVQADRDVIIVPGARGKHLDPSVRAWELPRDQLPTSARLGIDATIPEGIPRSRYQRLRPAFKDRVRLSDYLG